ncbi:MAG TPA: isocitrate lyase/phosphoenolpyruvate mutase family protein [Acidimicrobiales bacterium]|nr:isocitrate lyase/phosphoenolpyruvate mutase family protein [Acidimicrobiales bacterium]
MPSQADKARTFLELHRPGDPLLLPNPWDAGSAGLLVSAGFGALATTSGGFAASLGRLDGSVSRDEAIAHAASIVSSVDVPVSADLENCFSDDPSGVADTVRLAVGAGLAGCSVEDHRPGGDDPIYDLGLARERVAAACEAARQGEVHLVITARAENFLHGRDDLDDTIRRLQAYQEAGADVLYAPRLTRIEDIRAVVTSLDRPVNVLALPGVPSVEELAAAGVARISVGSGFANVAWGALLRAAAEFKQSGTYGWTELAGEGSKAVRSTFAGRQ